MTVLCLNVLGMRFNVARGAVLASCNELPLGTYKRTRLFAKKRAVLCMYVCIFIDCYGYITKKHTLTRDCSLKKTCGVVMCNLVLSQQK